jgi:hypothetical protein
MNLREGVSNVFTVRWREAVFEGNLESIASVMIPDIVDITICSLLRTIDQEMLPLVYTASNGKKVNLAEKGLGELVGWYMGSPSWRDEFARERTVNYVGDVDCSFDDLSDFEDPTGGDSSE